MGELCQRSDLPGAARHEHHAPAIALLGRDPTSAPAHLFIGGLGLGAQVAALLFVVGSYFLAEFVRKRQLRKAVEGDTRFYDVDAGDSTVTLDLSQVVYLRVETEDHRVGF